MSRLGALRPPRLDRPVALALVDTARASSTLAARIIAKRLRLKAAEIRPRIRYDNVSVGQYSTYIRSSRKFFPLIAFSARQNAVGVTASTPWNGKRQTFKSAFIANAGGSPRVFRRVGRSRLPIKQLWGPSVHGTFKQPDVASQVKANIKTRLPINLARRVKAEMRRKVNR
jgi:hypothetical protein